MRSSAVELPPRLMVSVRDCIDWEMALDAGVEIVDLPWTRAVSTQSPFDPLFTRLTTEIAMLPPTLGVSVDCGELSQRQELSSSLQIPASARWARLGLAGMANEVDWCRHWVAAREQWNATRSRPLSWWAVVYADHRLANAPSPAEIVAAAIETQCAGLVLDTFIKSGPTLTDLMSPQELTTLVQHARELQLPVVIAGGIESDDLEWVCDLEPAVIAVRTSVSRFGEFDQPLSPTRLAWFRQSLDDAVEFDRAAWETARELQFSSSSAPA